MLVFDTMKLTSYAFDVRNMKMCASLNACTAVERSPAATNTMSPPVTWKNVLRFRWTPPL